MTEIISEFVKDKVKIEELEAEVLALRGVISHACNSFILIASEATLYYEESTYKACDFKDKLKYIKKVANEAMPSKRL
jgi:hypothetical protein